MPVRKLKAKPRPRRIKLADYVRETWDADVATFRLCGMDEVGRGAYAGPLVAAAVVLPHRWRHRYLRDSKQLTAPQREIADIAIREAALGYAIAEISTADINHYGLGWANKEIFCRLVEMVEADGYCCDGRLRIDASRPVHTLVKGDDLIPAISAASIIAKVHRDALMRRMHEDAPCYNWASNKGYGALVHRRAIIEHGPHREHRNVFITNLMQRELNFGETVGAAG
jgi:ribonuclease HII